jgi:hypothetical protein
VIPPATTGRKDLFEFRVHAGANPFAVDAAAAADEPELPV